MAKINFKVNVGYSGYNFTFDNASDAAHFMAVAVKHISEDKIENISMEVVLMDKKEKKEADEYMKRKIELSSPYGCAITEDIEIDE